MSEKGGFTMKWNITADEIDVEFAANGTAYVALGFGDSMQGADMVVGFVDVNGKANALDMFCKAEHEAPKLDTSFGGTEDVDVVSGQSSNGRTTIRFKRKLDTGDKFDQAILPKGAVHLVYAW
jgi:hypothetical protein